MSYEDSWNQCWVRLQETLWPCGCRAVAVYKHSNFKYKWTPTLNCKLNKACIPKPNPSNLRLASGHFDVEAPCLPSLTRARGDMAKFNLASRLVAPPQSQPLLRNPKHLPKPLKNVVAATAAAVSYPTTFDTSICKVTSYDSLLR